MWVKSYVHNYFKDTITAGQSTTIVLQPSGSGRAPVVTIKPGAGGSATVLTSISAPGDIDDGFGTFEPIDHPNADASGVISELNPIIQDSPVAGGFTALKITAAAADCAVEILV